MTDLDTDMAGPKRSPTGRSAATCDAYEARARQLMLNCRKQLGDARGQVSTAALVSWLIERKGEWAASSWRQNKASVIYLIELAITKQRTRLQRERDPAALTRGTTILDAMKAALKQLEQETSKGCLAETEATSACKLKKFPEADRLVISAALAHNGGRYAADLDGLLLAGVRTGLRPCEWVGTVIVPSEDPGTLVLLVLNAKADGKRAHGPTRTLIFTALPADEQRIIKQWVARITAAGAGGDRLIKALGDRLYKLTRRIWPRRRRHYCLYSCRHEFAALAKLRYAPDVIAALMGHASDVTATNHYGRYRGRSVLPKKLQDLIDRLPAHSPEEAQRVRRRYDQKRARLADLRPAAAKPGQQGL